MRDPSDDADLAVAAGHGDRGAFAAIYDRHADEVFSFASRRLNDPLAAGAATRQTFAVAARRISGIRDPERLGPWLLAVAVRAVADQTPGPPTADAADGRATARTRDLLSGATPGLDDTDRLVLDLACGGELTGADLADALGLASKIASQQLARAMRRLQALLGPHSAAGSSSAAIAAALPISFAPIGMRAEVVAGFDELIKGGPDHAITPPWAAGPWRSDGFPSVRRRPRARVSAAVLIGAAALMLIGGGAAFAALLVGDEPPAPTAVAATTTEDDDGGLATVTLVVTSTTATPVGEPSEIPTTTTTTGNTVTTSPVSASVTPSIPTTAASPPPTTPKTTTATSRATTTKPTTATTPNPTTPKATTTPTTTKAAAKGNLVASEFSTALGVPRPKAGFFTLTNTGDKAVTWKATASVEWLVVKPATGNLPPGQSVEIGVAVDPTLTEWPGKATETVTVRGDGNGPEVVKIPHAT